jgi:5'-nucleotidase
MRVLITNDDGIDAPGIHALARAVRQSGFDVVVAAPAKESSGSSASISAVEEDGRVVVEERELPGLEGIAAYAVAGSPSFISILGARGAFGEPPQMVLSGVNRGANVGHAVLHSGTVGAALTAAEVGCRALAVSLDVLATATNASATTGGAVIADVMADETSRHWETAAGLAAELVDELTRLPPATVLNLNVPDVTSDRVRGLRRASLAPFGQVQMTVAEVGRGYVRMALTAGDGNHDAGTDVVLLSEGYATVTPIRAVAEATEITLSVS